MKYLLLTLIITLGLNACSLENGVDMESAPEESDTGEVEQKWKLVQMSGSIANVPPTTGSDMPWQEYYVLYTDSTFLKSRTVGGVEEQAGGTYAFVVLEDGEYLELSYASDNELIGNCSQEAKEFLYLENEDKLIGTWWACDGPGLVYQRVEE
ncbi:hypothetical protein WJR50_11260 [Catalinimonas sp. 4WD22]|uniref:hypothetical protein n=1 Tax=Catalinimonas locisalis TaxID=3133978 RepID=UPI0031018AE9